LWSEPENLWEDDIQQENTHLYEKENSKRTRQISNLSDNDEINLNTNKISQKSNKKTKKKVSKKKPQKKSWIWDWYKEVTLSNDEIVVECQAEITHEKICGKQFKTGGSTGNLISHLNNKHQIFKDTEKNQRVVIIFY